MMQTYVVEQRRHEGGPWSRVLTVQEDLVDEVAQMMPTEPGDWRLRELDPQPAVKVAEPRKASKIGIRYRVRWWFMLHFSKRARR